MENAWPSTKISPPAKSIHSSSTPTKVRPVRSPHRIFNALVALSNCSSLEILIF
ncbi:hypothetical protein Tcan_10663 [Toxocara canis]|uniref:Uncharacterized protein n=1 Tax=Toxocara canis TaxID=6265 RepID=A0A0B2VQB2_TOXCA|nr:hypothetical protein Tcan_10663 [Toxocara canis]